MFVLVWCEQAVGALPSLSVSLCVFAKRSVFGCWIFFIYALQMGFVVFSCVLCVRCIVKVLQSVFFMYVLLGIFFYFWRFLIYLFTLVTLFSSEPSVVGVLKGAALHPWIELHCALAGVQSACEAHRGSLCQSPQLIKLRYICAWRRGAWWNHAARSAPRRPQTWAQRNDSPFPGWCSSVKSKFDDC